MRLWLKNPLAIYTGTNSDAGAGLVIEGDRISELVASGQSPQQPVDQVFDASSLVLTPGLINAHHHFYQTLTRAFPAALNKSLFPWLRQLYPLWAGLDEACVALSTRLAVAELMLSGCTTVCDHHYLFNQNIAAAIDIQIEECMKLGARAVLTRGSMSLGQREGGLPPDSVSVIV